MRQPNLLPLLAILLLTVSCSKDSEAPSSPEIFDYEKTIFGKIDQLSQDVSSLYEGFDYLTSYPYYVVMLNPDNQVSTGYLFNPPVIPEGAFKLSETDGAGLEVYRYDNLIDHARNFLQGGLFSFTYDINGENYFLYDFYEIDNFYFNYKNQDNNLAPGLIIHELFHIFQAENWNYELNQHLLEYPLSQEIIELHLLQFDLMAEAYSLPSSEYTTYLTYYVAIWDALIALDTSPELLITTMGTTQELSEGSARYIEHFTLKDTFFPDIDDDPTHGFADFLTGVADENSLRSALLWRGWYHQGAIACSLLKQLGVDLEGNFERGITPYEQAASYLNLDEVAKSEALNAAKAKVDWPAYEERATELMALVD